MATIIIKTIKPSGGDYTSLAAWEAGEQRDLVTLNEIAVAECYSMSDITAVLVSGWVTDATHYIRIYTPVAERHDGKWNTAGYRLEPDAQYVSVLDVRAPYTQIDGLQIRRTHVGSGDTRMVIIFNGGASNCRLTNSILTAPGVSSVGLYMTSASPLFMYNNLIYDILGGAGVNGYGSLFAYNNTIVGCVRGFDHKTGDSSQIWVLKNNLVSGSTTADYVNGSGTFTVDYCASGDLSADDWAGTGNRISQTFTFVDALNKDFHLASADAGALDFGTDLSVDPNLSFTTDTDGQTRSGVWDIGADEYVATGGGSIFVSGIAVGLSSFAGNTGLVYGAAGIAAGLSAMSASAVLSYALNAPLTGLSAFSGSAIRDFSVSGTTTGISGATGLGGVGSGLAGSIAAASLSNAGLAILRVVSGVANILSLVYGDIRTSGQTILSGSTNSLSALNGGVALARYLGGAMAGNTALSASAGVFRAIDGVLSGVSLLRAGITGLAVKSISGHTNVFSTLPGGLVMEYGLGGSFLSGLLLRGDVHEVFSCGGSLSGAFWGVGTPAFIGPFSPAFRAGAPIVDVTRYGGGGSPTVQADSEMAKVTQDNINPGVTR